MSATPAAPPCLYCGAPAAITREGAAWNMELHWAVCQEAPNFVRLAAETAVKAAAGTAFDVPFPTEPARNHDRRPPTETEPKTSGRDDRPGAPTSSDDAVW